MLRPRYVRTIVLRIESHNPLKTRELRSFTLDHLNDAVQTASLESEYRDVIFTIQNMSDPSKKAWVR